MTCASCLSGIEKALDNTDGVISARVNLMADKAVVEFVPARVSPERLEQAVRELGYEASMAEDAAAVLDREQAARRRELRRQAIYLWLSVPLSIVMLGTFRDYWVFRRLPKSLGHAHLPWAFATPVVLGAGWQFLTNSYRGLRRGATDMNLLYATGIGAAYLIAVINTLWPRAGFGAPEAALFESVAGGQRFYFCNRACKEAFDRNPESCVSRLGGAAGRGPGYGQHRRHRCGHCC